MSAAYNPRAACCLLNSSTQLREWENLSPPKLSSHASSSEKFSTKVFNEYSCFFSSWSSYADSLDQNGRRIILLGEIDSSPALLIAERAAFPSGITEIEAIHASLVNIKNLGDNDIYRWYLASSAGQATVDLPDLKATLIYPCTPAHVKKYSPQVFRMVTETPEIFKSHVKPYMQKKRNEGRLNWVFNILEGREEQESVLLREPGQGTNPDEGFLLLPDLNWDRRTLTSLRLLALPERRDIWSVRDLKKGHLEWLRHMRDKILLATVKLYDGVESDMLKLYFHCLHLSYLSLRLLADFSETSPPITISIFMSFIQ